MGFSLSLVFGQREANTSERQTDPVCFEAMEKRIRLLAKSVPVHLQIFSDWLIYFSQKQFGRVTSLALCNAGDKTSTVFGTLKANVAWFSNLRWTGVTFSCWVIRFYKLTACGHFDSFCPTLSRHLLFSWVKRHILLGIVFVMWLLNKNALFYVRGSDLRS